MKRTERLVVGAGNLLEDKGIARAAEILRGGGTVAFPTETVYGLGANALEIKAVEGIFAAKERPKWDPLIVHVSSVEMAEELANVSDRAALLMRRFWPGPLTLLLKRKGMVPDIVTAGRDLVGLRMPSHPVAMALIRKAMLPIAAPSANRFGRTSPTTAEHVLEDLDGRIDAVLDGGATTVGVESTVLAVDMEPMVIYRPGAVTAEMIAEMCGDVTVFGGEMHGKTPESLPSPGVGIRHYAPRARLVLVEGEAEVASEVAGRVAAGEKVGVMLPAGWRVAAGVEVFGWGSWGDAEELARRVFAGLRELDGRGVEVIVCPVPEGAGMGAALRDRLGKAARVK